MFSSNTLRTRNSPIDLSTRLYEIGSTDRMVTAILYTFERTNERTHTHTTLHLATQHVSLINVFKRVISS